MYLAGGALGAVLAACGDDAATVGLVEDSPPDGTGTPVEEGAIVGDVLDYSIDPQDWAGAFGFVTLRLHRVTADGEDAFFIRTDTSDEAFAEEAGLVFAPRIGNLLDAAATAYVFEGGEDQPTVLSTHPGRDDYTPAWRLVRARWSGSARPLASADEVASAADAGDLELEETDIVVNQAIVKWPGGEMPVDDERTTYLGPGQLLEAPNTSDLSVTFKLHECFPGSYYIVVDTAAAPMAEGMSVVASPGLEAATGSDAVGRTNVFMNGIDGGPGPMGFQPSVFDSRAGDPAWSPYWDQFTYAWKDGETPEVLRTQEELHAARDEGRLEEFPGTPDTGGETFTVNCPVPVVAPNRFTG